jgi:LacI family transcriptional regulator
VATRQTTDIVAVNDPLVARILNHIRENADLLLSVNQLARKFGLSVRTIQRRFKEIVCRTPEEEILRIRLDRAKEYLRNTKMPVSEIARRLGFEDVSYFVRFFRLKSSQTPNQYRRQYPVALDIVDDPNVEGDDL